MIILDNFQFILHVVSEKKIIKNFIQSEGFYGPWQPCWITDRNESNNTWLDQANEHSCHAWSHLLQWFSRRWLKCLRTDDGCQVMAIAHLTRRVRWDKNQGLETSKYLASEFTIFNKTQDWTRGSQEPVIAHLVFNLTSKVDRKWGCYT